MMCPKLDSHPDQRHQEVWELLPWCMNRTLEAQERAHVEQHLAPCPACQEEVTRCHHIATATTPNPDLPIPTGTTGRYPEAERWDTPKERLKFLSVKGGR
jgi:anti-sigma factor RsiW